MGRGLVESARRVAQLDSLRGIAALLVVLHHSRQAFINDVNDATTGLSAYLDMGRLGVVIFFIISGFVIVKAVPGRGPRPVGLFWKHRFFRLFPAFWISVILATIVAQLVAGSQCCAFATPVSRDIVLANMTMIPLRLHEPMLIGVYWSLELELFFYGLISAIALAGRNVGQNGARTVTLTAFGMFFAAIVAAGATAIREGTGEIGKDQVFLALLHLSLMFAGSALRYHWDGTPRRETFLRDMPVALKAYLFLQLGFFVGVAAIKMRHGIEPHTFRVAATYLLGIGGFLWCLRSFDGSWLGTVVGNRSYGIYLIHVPVMSLLSYAIARSVLPPLGYATYLIATLALTMLLADLMRRFVERPAIRLGHLHDRWVSNRRVLTVVAPPVAALAVEPIPAPANDALAGPSTQQA